MKKTKIIFICFLVLAIIQIAVPLSMIVRREMTLKNGKQYKFKTAPVDPYDAFRGRYVALNLEEGIVQVNRTGEYHRGEKVYAVLKEDEDGFAKIIDLIHEKPESGDYIKTRIRYNTQSGIHLDLPFDRYYMNEEDAPVTEALYLKFTRGDRRDAFITIRVKCGFAVLEELYIQNKPIGQFLEEEKKRQRVSK
ncbi:MAG: GDYXXLXY domain-containing protein [Candidatus Aureabacteria bacterium]|nr:GDYXXLXY domain-containing protein [Candidatus Auribacterota bacterium]